jgi:hypothetical protein
MSAEEFVKKEFPNASVKYNGLSYEIRTGWANGIVIGSGTFETDAWRAARESVINMLKHKPETLK